MINKKFLEWSKITAVTCKFLEVNDLNNLAMDYFVTMHTNTKKIIGIYFPLNITILFICKLSPIELINTGNLQRTDLQLPMYDKIPKYLCLSCIFFVCLGFYVTSTKYRSYRDVPALLVEEDLRRPSVHYFRHKWAPDFHVIRLPYRIYKTMEALIKT
jgi:hypothetical protein